MDQISDMSELKANNMTLEVWIGRMKKKAIFDKWETGISSGIWEYLKFLVLNSPLIWRILLTQAFRIKQSKRKKIGELDF